MLHIFSLKDDRVMRSCYFTFQWLLYRLHISIKKLNVFETNGKFYHDNRKKNHCIPLICLWMIKNIWPCSGDKLDCFPAQVKCDYRHLDHAIW